MDLKLKAADSIIEPTVLDVLRSFLTQDGAPHLAIQYLSQSYEGYAQMCNLTAHWLRLAGDSDVHGHARTFLTQSALAAFDPVTADAYVGAQKAVPEWLSEMVALPEWRQLIYSLSQQHPQSQLLSFSVLLVAEAGHYHEITGVNAANAYFHVYARVVGMLIKELLAAEPSPEHLTQLLGMVGYGEHTYVYAQALLAQVGRALRAAGHSGGAAAARRVAEAVAGAAGSRLAARLTALLHLPPAPAHSELPDLLLAVLHAGLEDGSAVVVPDVAVLKKDAPDPAVVEYLQRGDFLEKLLFPLFDPGVSVGSERTLLVQLLARTLPAADTPALHAALDALFPVCRRHYTGSALQQVCATSFAPHLAVPLAARGLVHWASLVLGDASWMEAQVATTSLQTLLDLLLEVARVHPRLVPVVYDVLLHTLELPLELDLLPLFKIRTRVVDTLVFLLLECGCVGPVLAALAALAATDPNLTRHALTLLLTRLRPPYRAPFLRDWLRFLAALPPDVLRESDVAAELQRFVLGLGSSEFKGEAEALLRRVSAPRAAAGAAHGRTVLTISGTPREPTVSLRPTDAKPPLRHTELRAPPVPAAAAARMRLAIPLPKAPRPRPAPADRDRDRERDRERDRDRDRERERDREPRQRKGPPPKRRAEGESDEEDEMLSAWTSGSDHEYRPNVRVSVGRTQRALRKRTHRYVDDDSIDPDEIDDLFS